MAKRKKGSDVAVPTSSSGARRINIGIEQAENGAVVHLSSEGTGKKGEYVSKTMVAPDHHSAMRIATSHIQSMAPKLKKKGGKKSMKKRSLGKV